MAAQKTDIQLAMEHVCTLIESTNHPAYPDRIPERVADGVVVFRVFFVDLVEPLDYSLDGDYAWSDCRIQVEGALVGADTTYDTLWAAAAAVHHALQRTVGAPQGGTIFLCDVLAPFQQADPVDSASDIKRVGGQYAVKAKAS